MVRALLIFVATFYCGHGVTSRRPQDQQDYQQSCSQNIGIPTNEHYIAAVGCWLKTQQRESAFEYIIHLTISLRMPLDGWKLTVRLARDRLQLDGVEVNDSVGERSLSYHVDGPVLFVQEENMASGSLEIEFKLIDRKKTPINLHDISSSLWPALVHAECLRCGTFKSPALARLCIGRMFDAVTTVAAGGEHSTAKTSLYRSIIHVHRTHGHAYLPSSCLIDFYRSVRIDSVIGCTMLRNDITFATRSVIELARTSKDSPGVCLLGVSYKGVASLYPPRVLCTVCKDFVHSNLKKRSTGIDDSNKQDIQGSGQMKDCDDEDDDCPSGSARQRESGSAVQDDITDTPLQTKTVSTNSTVVTTATQSTSTPAKQVNDPSSRTNTPSSGTTAISPDVYKTQRSPVPTEAINNRNEVEETEKPTERDSDNNFDNEDDDNGTDTDTTTDGAIPIGNNSTTNPNSIDNPNLAKKQGANVNNVTSSGVWIGIGTVIGLLLLCAFIAVIIVVSHRRKSARGGVKSSEVTNVTDGGDYLESNQTATGVANTIPALDTDSGKDDVEYEVPTTEPATVNQNLYDTPRPIIESGGKEEGHYQTPTLVKSNTDEPNSAISTDQEGQQHTLPSQQDLPTESKADDHAPASDTTDEGKHNHLDNSNPDTNSNSNNTDSSKVTEV